MDLAVATRWLRDGSDDDVPTARAAWISVTCAATLLVIVGADDAIPNWILALGTWLILLLLGRLVPKRRVLQALVVILYAALIELVFAWWLNTYSYRHGPVAAYVWPGHGILFLGAWCLGLVAMRLRGEKWFVRGWVVLAALLALGALTSTRSDHLGVFWAVCLIGFLLAGSEPPTYAGVATFALILEYLGTSVGAWHWASVDPVMGWVSMGDPPAVPGGGYVWFAAAAIGLVDWCLGLRPNPFRRFPQP